MTDYLYLDFETTSQADIKKVGAFAYVHHPSTQPTLLAWSRGDRSGLVDFTEGERVPSDLLAGDPVIVAWNAEFDRLVWNRFCSPRLPAARWLDAAVLAASVGFPRSLDGATGQKLQLPPLGRRWCMTTPIREMRLTANASQRERYWSTFRDYCVQDVRAMREFVERWLPLPDWLERVLFEDALHDALMNERGIPVNREAIRRAKVRLQKLLPDMVKQFGLLTGGLRPTQRDAVLTWLRRYLPELPDLREQTLLDALERPHLPPHVRGAITIRLATSKASVKKLDTMLAASEADGRVHGGIVTVAAGTGRAAGRLVQPQNLPRPSITQPEIEAHFMTGFEQADTQAISDCLRGFIRSPDGPLSAVDYSNIEGRVLAWLAGEDWKVEAFRQFDAGEGEGEDIYLLAAQRAGVPGQRQIGKTIELACGYQGALGAFQTMAAITGVQVPDDRARELVRAWREAHPRIVQLWERLEAVSLHAVSMQGGVLEVNERLRFIREPGYLWLELPSGRRIAYRSPRIGLLETEWGAPRRTVFFRNTTLTTPQPTYGGKLTENATQAVARDILYDALGRALKAGLRVVMHVHDEIVIEGDETERRRLERIMREAPAWAKGLPIAVEGWTHWRYRK